MNQEDTQETKICSPLQQRHLERWGRSCDELKRGKKKIWFFFSHAHFRVEMWARGLQEVGRSEAEGGPRKTIIGDVKSEPVRVCMRSWAAPVHNS
jgi:hypothetical protein